MIGAIYGDIVGSVYEFHRVKTKDFSLLSEKNHFTDDSVMTLAVANALMLWHGSEKSDDIEHFQYLLIREMHRMGRRYPRAGYGGRFHIWLRLNEFLPYGSFGNGSAMRVSPVAWYARSLEEVIALAKASAEVTHNHPEGIKGAVVTAGATYLARTGATREEIRRFAEGYYDIGFTLDEIRPTYSFDETCQRSVPQAMVAFLESHSFEDAIRNAVSLGGDSDTLAAIAGAIAQAYYGMEEEEKAALTYYLDDYLWGIVRKFGYFLDSR